MRQTLPDAVTLTEPLGASIQHVSTRVVEEGDRLHASVDLTWMIRPHIGVGGLGGCSSGSIDLPDSTGSMTIGGLTIGIELRARF